MGRIIGRFMAFAMALLLLFATATQAIGLPVESAHTLTVLLAPEGMPVADATVRLYRLARYADGQPIPTQTVQQLPLNFGALAQQGVERFAYTFENYLAAAHAQPDFVQTTDAQGKALFTHLPDGVYLGVTEGFVHQGNTYFVQSFAVQLQGDLTVEPKLESAPLLPFTLSVVKQWQKDEQAYRPANVQVQLFENGKAKQTVTLSEQNGWQWHWQNLDPQKQYHVIETALPQDYWVAVARQTNCFVVTNTKVQSLQTPTQPNPPQQTLPQTGLTWWPIPLCAALGLLLLLVGWLLRRKE